MPILPLILKIFAFVFFAIAAFWNPAPDPWHNRLVASGLACWVLSEIVGGFGAISH
jgi:hypothetical protein